MILGAWFGLDWSTMRNEDEGENYEDDDRVMYDGTSLLTQSLRFGLV